LCAVLAWCLDPDAPNLGAIEEALREAEATTVVSKLERAYVCPKAAARALRLLWSLYILGFAAYG
ncbi:MAG: hypothetical protein V1772_06960, partial [Chloroflexota bacterium]